MIIESEQGNMYFFNPNKKYFSLINPLLNEFCEHNFDLEKLKSKGYSDEEIVYYKSKYDFLKSNKIIYPTRVKKFNYKMTADDVRFSLQKCTDIMFEVTTSCNISCEYCFYGGLYNHEKPKNQNLSINKAFQLLNYIINLKTKNNSSFNEKIKIHFYGGEPLLNINFIKEVIGYVNQLSINITFEFGLTSNAILLSKHIDFLAQNNVNLLISLDGDRSSNSYRKFKNGKITYDRVIQNSLLIKEKHSQYFQKSVNFNAVIHNRNNIENVHTFFKKTFEKVPLTADLNSNGIKQEKKEAFFSIYRSINQMYQEIDNKKVKEDLYDYDSGFNLALDFIEKYSPSFYNNAIELISNRENIKQYPTGTCLPFSRSIFLNANGNIMPCVQISPVFSLGNVTEETVEIDYQKIANLYNVYFEKVNNQCQLCYNNEYCNKCIFNISGIQEKPVCSDFQNKNNFRKFVSYITSSMEKNDQYREIILKRLRNEY